MSDEIDLDTALGVIEHLKMRAERLGAALDLVLHDAHPWHGNTTGWRGGIGGQAMTMGCSISDPPPQDAVWTQYDLTSKPLREYLSEFPFDLDQAKIDLKQELNNMIEKSDE